ncbi:hypothetical protein WN944_001608 [Citrus x changshan-huyou]|uniref:Uncharacterized protein n=1 Tax=Citrus x changshan-huyou TaxID=2935761 RepID=A0AAP0QMU6_9ROSI
MCVQDAFAKCPPLCLTLKVFLQHRELNDVYSGGIGSYALLTMIMAVLKVRLCCILGFHLDRPGNLTVGVTL